MGLTAVNKTSENTIEQVLDWARTVEVQTAQKVFMETIKDNKGFSRQLILLTELWLML